MSSAGNTRGLIEAVPVGTCRRTRTSLPRGIPAASLKRGQLVGLLALCRRLPRGIPAASLKRTARAWCAAIAAQRSSAGNTRGLIEARRRDRPLSGQMRLPRGIPAASLKPILLWFVPATVTRLPRGIPAASLKQLTVRVASTACDSVFRGEYPRPH